MNAFDFKKTLKYVTIFVVLCIIIYASNGVINVDAKELPYNFTSSYYYLNDLNNKSTSGTKSLVDRNILYYIPSDNNNRQTIRYLTYDIHRDLTVFDNTFNDDDYVYFKAIAYFHSYFDISLIDNFSFNANLATAPSDYYNLYFVYNSTDFYATIEDYDTYITINSSGEYAYNEVLLFSLKIPYSKIKSYSSLGVGIASNQKYSSQQVVDYCKIHGSIPTINKNSFMQINQLIISDEEIVMSLEDFDDPLDLERYSSDDVLFPEYEEDVQDDSILGWIKRIFNKILDTFKMVISLPLNLIAKLKLALISAFVPSEDFFDLAWDANIKLLEDNLGFLFFPFSIFEKVFNAFLNLGEGSGIIHIPELKDPFYSQTLVSAQDLNLKQIFSTGAIGTIYDVYLVVVDIIVIVGLISLCFKKFNSIFKGGQE